MDGAPETFPADTLVLVPLSASIRAEYPDARDHLLHICRAHGWAVARVEERSTHRGTSLVAFFPDYERPAVAVLQAHLMRGVLVRLGSVARGS